MYNEYPLSPYVVGSFSSAVQAGITLIMFPRDSDVLSIMIWQSSMKPGPPATSKPVSTRLASCGRHSYNGAHLSPLPLDANKNKKQR